MYCAFIYIKGHVYFSCKFINPLRGNVSENVTIMLFSILGSYGDLQVTTLIKAGYLKSLVR